MDTLLPTKKNNTNVRNITMESSLTNQYQILRDLLENRDH